MDRFDILVKKVLEIIKQRTIYILNRSQHKPALIWVWNRLSICLERPIKNEEWCDGQDCDIKTETVGQREATTVTGGNVSGVLLMLDGNVKLLTVHNTNNHSSTLLSEAEWNKEHLETSSFYIRNTYIVNLCVNMLPQESEGERRCNNLSPIFQILQLCKGKKLAAFPKDTLENKVEEP